MYQSHFNIPKWVHEGRHFIMFKMVDFSYCSSMYHLAYDTVNNSSTFGPGGVRALPLAAGINKGCHYFRYFSFLFVLVTTAIQNQRKGVFVGFQIFAWAPKYHKY